MIGRVWARACAVLRGASARPAAGAPAVFYGVPRMAGPTEHAFGGTVKFQSLQDLFPNTPRAFNLVYLVSSGIPPAAAQLVRAAKRRGARFVWNQNGVGFAAWHGPGWERVNEPMRALLGLADHVFYQSEFCRLAADRFVGASTAPSEVLYNAVDTQFFLPPERAPARPLTLLAAGSHWQWYRVQIAIDALAEVRQTEPHARLMIAGRFCWEEEAAAARRVREHARARGVEAAVEVLGAYRQADAPHILGRGDILVHAKCNDPCPTLVLEAMACGLPVVYSASGGTPELVGDAGYGVSSRVDWEFHEPPAAGDVAAAVLTLARELSTWRERARKRALRFDVGAWRRRHREVFESLMRSLP